MRFVFGDHMLDTDRRELTCGDRLVAVEPQVFDLVAYLVANHDRVVSKDDLLVGVWGGRIVSDATIDSRINAARRAVGDTGAAQVVIRTFARKGLRFVAEVIEEATSARTGPKGDKAAGVDRGHPGHEQTGERPAVQTGPELSDKPSIAVLPFANLSGDPDQEYFADGTAEDIITALSRYPSLFVIARTSSFAYRNQAVDIRRMGRELGVRYVLEGSVRKAGDRVRTTAQLIEAVTGNHVWANRYDGSLADIFAVQDEITEAVTRAIVPAVEHAEREAAIRRQPENPSAWEICQRGSWHIARFSGADLAAAKDCFRRGIPLDANFAPAYCGLALAIFYAAELFGAEPLAEAMAAAEPLTRRAVMLDPTNAAAHVALGHIALRRGDHPAAIAVAEHAIALSPSNAEAHAERGLALLLFGRPHEGLDELRVSIRLDPYAPRLLVWYTSMMMGQYFARDYEAAIESARMSLHRYPDHVLPYRWLAASFGQLGRAAEARQALEQATSIAPAAFDLYVKTRMPWHRVEDHEHMLDGLRKTGWAG